MNTKMKALLTSGAAVALTMATAFTAQAAAQASGTVKPPYVSGGKLVAEANLNGPVPVGTVFCVRLLAVHPMTPDVEIATTCKKSNGGTLKATVKTPPCGMFATWADASYKGRATWTAQTKYVVICK
ncbi:hypothetical protein [Streptomyces sp. NBC_00829]|uniref:hypothetical protein n=1 Tax=Streptomyces sp. NBC_00829 TaxID=2903679 RepID=UPI00386A1233|nr:hypothetical protein OG293_12560 [Streptomyces sp. NBC_00829]